MKSVEESGQEFANILHVLFVLQNALKQDFTILWSGKKINWYEKPQSSQSIQKYQHPTQNKRRKPITVERKQAPVATQHASMSGPHANIKKTIYLQSTCES